MKKSFNTFLIIVFCVASFAALAKAPLKYYCPPCGSDCDKLEFTAPGKCPHCAMMLVTQTEDEHQKALAAKKLKVAFYLQNGVEVLDFAGPMEVLAYAGLEIFTVSKTKDQITSQGILKIMPDYSIADAPKADIIMFFGGNSGVAANDTAVIGWLKKQQPQYYLSVCTGAFVLAKAGLLDNLTVTTFHESIESLKKAAPKATVLNNARFVDNGNIITTAGISAGIDGALHLVTRLRGEDAAKQIAAYMEYDKWQPGQGVMAKK